MGYDDGIAFDADDARRVEALHLTPNVVDQRREGLRQLAPAPGERVLNVGSGPGLLAGELAAAVGLTVESAGPSTDMLTLARA
jgi:arsenite methyltransferase